MNKEVSAAHYRQFCAYLKAHVGIVLGDKKQYLVKSRILPIASKYGFDDINTALESVIKNTRPEFTQKAVEAMTTNETLWFRDNYPFDILTNNLLPQLAKTNSKLNIWSAACASGQEPYSIAISILEFKHKNPHAFPQGVNIVATDLSAEMVEASSQGIYDELALSRGLPAALKQKYFTAVNDKQFQVNPNVKQLITFKQMNLIKHFSWPAKFDIVFCRNVLIYFDLQQKTDILQNISACLLPQASLFLGASESLAGAQNEFKMVKESVGLYYSKL